MPKKTTKPIPESEFPEIPVVQNFKAADKNPKESWLNRHKPIAFGIIAFCWVASGFVIYKQVTVRPPDVVLPQLLQTIQGEVDPGKAFVHSEFEFNYPTKWINSKETATNHGKVLAAVQDLDRKDLDTGSKYEPIFLVRTYSSAEEIPPIKDQLQAMENEIEATERPIGVNNQLLEAKIYKSFFVEGAYLVTHQATLNHNNKVYVLEFSYILAGCMNKPDAETCDKDNLKLRMDSEIEWGLISSSFKFKQ